MTRGAGRANRVGAFGSVDKLATGYRARYFGPDGRRYKAPTLFRTKQDARAWLSLRHAEIVRKAWEPPEATSAPAPKLTFKTYSDTWLPARKVKGRPLKDRTAEHYRYLLDEHILPGLGTLPIGSITRDDVNNWYDKLSADTPTARAHSYGLLKTIMGSAVADGKAPFNPCVLKGAGSAKRAHKVKPATLPELEVLTATLPERFRLMALLGAWCAMRYGELTELRRCDVDVSDRTIRIRRGVVRTRKGFNSDGGPKSDAGIRDVAVPPHLMTAIEQHLAKHVGPQPDALLFPAASGGHLASAAFYRHYYKARDLAGRPDLRFHDLRHTGAVLAAQKGATLAELMARLGHSTPAAAMRYQHAAAGRDRQIAELLSTLVKPVGAPTE